MKLKSLIADLQKMEQVYGGDIECFSAALFEDCYARYVNNVPNKYPDEFNMPDKFLIIGDSN